MTNRKSFIGCRYPSGFSSTSRSQLNAFSCVHGLGPGFQPTSKTCAPQRSTPPVKQPPFGSSWWHVCTAKFEPGHNSADEVSVLLLQLSGTLFLFICAHHPSAFNPALQPSYTSLWERSVLRVNLHAYLQRHLLPPKNSAHRSCSLTKRKHYYQLPIVEFSQHKSCFINRCLFKFRWLFSVWFVFNVLCVLELFKLFYISL